jgi:hypothetical protein
MSVEGASGSMSMGPNSQPLPPQQISMMKADLMRNPLYLASIFESLDAVYEGTETIDGVSVEKITVNADPQFSLLLDSKTNLPAFILYNQVNPMSGEVQQVKEVFGEWQSFDGVSYPTKREGFGGEKKASSSVIKSFKAN